MGDKYFHIFLYWWPVLICWKWQHPVLLQSPEEGGTTTPGQPGPPLPPLYLPTHMGPGDRSKWEHAHIVRGFGLVNACCNRHWGGQGEGFLLQTVFPALGWIQIPLACSEQLSSPRCWQKESFALLLSEAFKYLYFRKWFPLTSRLRKTRPRSLLLKDFFPFLLNMSFFFHFSGQLLAASRHPCCLKMGSRWALPPPACLAPERP